MLHRFQNRVMCLLGPLIHVQATEKMPFGDTNEMEEWKLKLPYLFMKNMLFSRYLTFCVLFLSAVTYEAIWAGMNESRL